MRKFREIYWEFRENQYFIFAKFRKNKIISSKFRVSQNFQIAVSQPPYLSVIEISHLKQDAKTTIKLVKKVAVSESKHFEAKKEG